MVKHVTSLTGNGIADWLIQRVSAVILAAYTVFLVGFLLASQELTYAAWAGLFAQGWVKIFSLLAFLSFVAHAWVGIWTATTDYLQKASLRVVIQLAVALVLFVYFVVAFNAVWGV